MKAYFDVDKDFDIRDTYIVKEVYDTDHAHQTFTEELERALETGYSMIMIEPTPLGDETARWIAVGNCLHKTAVIFGVGAIFSGYMWPNHPFAYAPLGVGSIFCTALYTVSWQFDPCVKYQVYADPVRLAKRIQYQGVGSTVVLVRKNDNRRKIIHCGVTLASTIFCAWKLYKVFNN